MSYAGSTSQVVGRKDHCTDYFGPPNLIVLLAYISNLSEEAHHFKRLL